MRRAQTTGSADDAAAQKTSTFVSGFIVGLISPGVTPLAALPQSGSLDETSTRTPQEQSVLLTVAKKCANAPTSWTRLGRQILDRRDRLQRTNRWAV